MNRKVTVVGGAGNVGMTVARAIAEKALADVVIIDAPTPAMAVATLAPVLAVFKRGRQTVDRPRARLLRPA